MRTKIQKWGNSLGLRIPKAFTEEAGLEEGATVDLSLDGGRLIIRLARPRYDLEELLSGVTRSNRHGEIETGDRMGREAW